MKKNLSKQRIFDIEEKFLAYKLLPKHDKLDFLKQLLSNDYENVNITNQTIYYEKFNVKYALLDATHIEKLTNNDLINLLCELPFENIKEIQIVCNEKSNDLNLNILKDCTIKIINKTMLFESFFEHYKTFPNAEKINLKSPKLTLKEIAKNFFLPQKSKSYFFCGLILIFSSIILPCHIYYLVFGTALLIFSILCRILPKH